ncbi:hypothetical protein BT93_L3801 [Corymbia citriodora subsp. variegata]|uniref:Uncharacterized protein n=1 Tax=Corymbia citriodora subsp. variegata TaxID=360336 RepID=A0A8T0CKT1_CORYI|nr:hypothetical protein BT93_L3801 [Corymbia citriodora subsp. variegata]
MGISSSKKRVESSLHSSPEFDSACDSAYAHCLSSTQHAFDGVFPYQLSSAAAHLHRSLSSTSPLVSRWLPSPPSQSQVDRALRATTRRRPLPPAGGGGDGPQLLDAAEFREWGVELFAGAVVESAGRAVLTRVPIGVAGIAGLGMATRSGKEVIGSVIGVYALGVATLIYLGLSG